jgi:hypothetical protein
MKANETPEKIYMTPSFGEPDNVLLATFSKSHLNFHRDIEYTRTDAFIDKACDAFCKVCGHYPHTVPTHICRQDCDYFKDFKYYMKKE